MTQTTTAVKYTTLTPQKFAEALKSDSVFLIDVRHADEYAAGHIKGAVNIDVMQSDFMNKAQDLLPKNQEIAVYCGTGKRSGMASDELSAAGYDIINLGGGLEAWQQAGYPFA